LKHLELVNLVNDNKDLIDRAYREGRVQNVDEVLADSTLFVKISGSYKLNKNYLNFVDSVLQRVDYSIIFGDYEKEYKELVKNKNRFLENANEHYKKQILDLIENLFFKFFNRDREIQVLLLRVEHDTSLDIDILIQNANDILEKIDELIEANTKIGQLFRVDLKELDDEIDTLLSSISVDILRYIQNIDTYIKQISQFLIQTKNRRLQNKKLTKLANLILEEKTLELDEYLSVHKKHLFHTIVKNQKNKIVTYPSDRDIYKINKAVKVVLDGFEVKKKLKTSLMKPQQKQKLDIINIDNILKDLSDAKCEDIFVFIHEHKELSMYEDYKLKEEAFKLFLQITTHERLHFKDEFNEFGIKVAKWE